MSVVHITNYCLLYSTDGSRIPPLIIIGKKTASEAEIRIVKDHGGFIVYGPKVWMVST